MSAKPSYEELERKISGLEKKVAQFEELQKSVFIERQKIFHLLQNLPGYVFIEAPDHSICYANGYFYEQFGDPEGMLCYDLLLTEPDSTYHCPALQALQTMTVANWERQEAPDGKSYLVYDYPFYNENSSTPLVLELGIDITAHKLVGQEREMLIDELQYAVSQVKSLHTLIPICASCRQIRNDERYWQQVNEYVRTHSLSVYAMGLCPECMERIYAPIEKPGSSG